MKQDYDCKSQNNQWDYTIHCKLRKDEYEKLRKLAIDDNRTLNGYLRNLLKQAEAI